MSKEIASRVLIVADVEINITNLNLILINNGFVASTIVIGTKIVEEILTFSPDLILVDIIKPQNNNFDICNVLTNEAQLKNIPILFLTDRQDENAIVKVFERGGTDFISKPIIESELLARLRTHVKQKRLTSKLSREIKKRRLSYKSIEPKEKEEKRDCLKSMFMANMSQEITKPLNEILDFTQLLINEDVTGQKRLSFIQRIDKNAKQLSSIINNVIDIANLEYGEVKITNSNCNLKQLLNNLISKYKHEIEQNNLEIELLLDSQLKTIEILTDITKLHKILDALIDNALKFTHEGHIEIGCIKDKDRLKFYVSDTGIGIAPQHHSIIFDRFRQAEESHTRKYGGNGLGLSIAKEYVEMLNGKIGLTSELGKGSTFYFHIPLVVKN